MGTLSVWPCRSLCGITYLFSFLWIYVSTRNRWYILWLTLWRRWLQSCRMFILLVECGLMHRDDCINCETCYFCFDPAFVWPSLGRTDFHCLCLACKPFLGLCACTWTGRWCASVVAIRSLFTNRADRRSQINSVDSWCATRISKTLDVVHRYALLVSNNDVL